MKVGIIGAGFTGLTAGLRLAEKGHGVVIFESLDRPGGLAVGFETDKWKWRLEKHYHHLFTSDRAIRKIAGDIDHKIVYKKAITSTYLNGKIFRLDSPIQLLKFQPLPFADRLRTGVILFYLKISPFWRMLEKTTSREFLTRSMGKLSWQILWRPLFEGKFGSYSSDIPASWFWARIKKRSSSLGYPEGGFQSLAEKLSDSVEKNGGRVIYNTAVTEIKKKGKKIIVESGGGSFDFDRVICTLPKNLSDLKFMGAVNLVLSLDCKFFSDGTYWLNVADRDFPFLGVMEHTNLVDKDNYGGETILYVGNYLPLGHSYFDKSSKELLEIFTPYLKKISSNFDKSFVLNSRVFKAPYAQPVFPLNYSKKIPGFATPVRGLFLANIQQVYPWDRGTNYAVELGEKVAKLIDREHEI